MPRKNSKVRSRRTRREHRGEQVRTPDFTIPRVRTTDMVIPDGKCPGRVGKPRFADEEKALKALAQAQANRARVGSPWVEKRVYECPVTGCNGWHLSSREEFDEDQATQLHNQRNQETS